MNVQEIVEKLYREDSRRIFATLIRLLGDIDLAEESMHDAFKLAMKQWPLEGIPDKPFAWLVSTARFRGIDRIRRERRVTSLDQLEETAAAISDPSPEVSMDPVVPDDQLRLIFICCHPALSSDAQVALTMREVCGLTTEEIANAFLASTPTIAQRIVRAKAKIRDAKIPYQIPSQSELPARLASVLRVIYLVFNEGYSPSSGALVTRGDLSQEAIRLTRWLLQLLPVPEVSGLLALMLLHESRREARSDDAGNLVPLDEQDRGRWNVELMTEGTFLVRQSLASGGVGPYALQAAISAIHADAKSASDTDWNQIVGFYDLLVQLVPTPIVELNRAVAVAMRDGPLSGLALIDNLLELEELQRYHLAHAARADLCRRLGHNDEALVSYQHALDLTQQEPERRFLQNRMDQLLSSSS
jgi:RNA polymerase sigma-70 factor (ECF subfamily)